MLSLCLWFWQSTYYWVPEQWCHWSMLCMTLTGCLPSCECGFLLARPHFLSLLCLGTAVFVVCEVSGVNVRQRYGSAGTNNIGLRLHQSWNMHFFITCWLPHTLMAKWTVYLQSMKRLALLLLNIVWPFKSQNNISMQTTIQYTNTLYIKYITIIIIN